MNYKRALQFGVMLWILIFVIISILIFIPPFQHNDVALYIALWIINIPMVLFLAKWYFKAEKPSLERGVTLGVIAILVGTVLDLAIVHLFFEGTYMDFVREFYGNWMLYVGFIEVVALCAYAGFEFDGTYSKNA